MTTYRHVSTPCHHAACAPVTSRSCSCHSQAATNVPTRAEDRQEMSRSPSSPSPAAAELPRHASNVPPQHLGSQQPSSCSVSALTKVPQPRFCCPGCLLLLWAPCCFLTHPLAAPSLSMHPFMGASDGPKAPSCRLTCPCPLPCRTPQRWTWRTGAQPAAANAVWR